MRLPSPFIRFGLPVRAYSVRERCTAKAGDECASRGRYIYNIETGERERVNIELSVRRTQDVLVSMRRYNSPERRCWRKMRGAMLCLFKWPSLGAGGAGRWQGLCKRAAHAVDVPRQPSMASVRSAAKRVRRGACAGGLAQNWGGGGSWAHLFEPHHTKT